MRGDDWNQSAAFCYLSLEEMVPQARPLREIRGQADECLKEISGKLSRLYSKLGRPSIAPEKLLRALLLQGLYSVRSERMLMEQLHHNFLFRWFGGLDPNEAVSEATVFLSGSMASGAGTGPIIGRAFFRGWNADRGLGQREELPTARGTTEFREWSARESSAA